jgi:hypothetical protein
MLSIQRAARYLNRLSLARERGGGPRHDWALLGSDYGGWWVPLDRLGERPVCVLAGAGEDVTFDVALARRLGARVITVDPTPRAIDHVRGLLEAAAAGRPFTPGSGRAPTPYDLDGFDPAALTLVPKGLSRENAAVRFFAPRNAAEVSHSMTNLQGTTDYFVADCVTVDRLMDEAGIERIDLMKLDIEGAEHAVIADMLSKSIRPTVVCAEFDQPCELAIMRATVRRLKAAGYAFARIDRWNLTFVRND